MFYPNDNHDLVILHADEKIKVNFEIDTNPPKYANTELKYRLAQSGFIDTDYELTKESLINLLHQRFDEIDFEEAKKDVAPFIPNLTKLDLWSKEFFKEITTYIVVHHI